MKIFINESIGGEIPFYISSYNPSQEVYIFSEIERLKID